MKLWNRPVGTPLFRRAPATLLAILGSVLGSFALSTPASAHVMPLTERQIAAGSPHVVVGVVESVRTLWNEQRTFPFTEYTVRVEERLRGDSPERITVSMPGGTVDGRTYGTCLSFPLESGSRYLLFLQNLDQRVLVPVTGGWQGAFREVRGARGKSLAARVGDGDIQMDFARLVRSTRELLERVEAEPRPADTAWMRTVDNPDLPAQPYAPFPATGSEPRQVTARATPSFYVEHPAVAPLVFDPLPPDSPFSPADREMITYWNIYLREPLFLVNPDPVPGWAIGNGASEIAGFPSSATLKEQVGTEWGPGSYAGITYIYDDAGNTVEADIFMNPERNWIVGDTEPESFGWNEDATFSFKPVLLQHLATAWGYQGTRPFEEPIDPARMAVDSIANHGPFSVAALMAIDAAALRATYGGKPIHDGLVSPYAISLSHRTLADWSYSLPSVLSAKAGSVIQFSDPFKIENPGTSKLVRPTIEIYLAPQRGSLQGAVLLKRLRLRNNLRPGDFRRVAPGSARIPPKTPAGTYHIVFVLRDPRDAYQPNNRAWSHPEITFEVTR